MVQAPILRGAAGMVDLEFKVGKTPAAMQRAVVARIKLNDQLLCLVRDRVADETGWGTRECPQPIFLLGFVNVLW